MKHTHKQTPAMQAKEKAIKAAGGVAALSKTLGISSQAISQWATVPPNRAVAVERATGGEVTRAELCPDIFEGFAQ